MEHVILYFIDHTCEHTPWEDLEECKAYVDSAFHDPFKPSIIESHFIKIDDPNSKTGSAFFRLGEVGKDDWYVHRKGTM